MGIRINGQAAANRLTVDSPAGCYRSAKGSIAIKPDTNGKFNGCTDGVDTVMVTDIDNGRTGFKKIRDLKGVYTFVCNLDQADLVVNA